ncbi:MAG: hypothetical protein ACR2HB_11395 [Dehalococcoidia bacterium]
MYFSAAGFLQTAEACGLSSSACQEIAVAAHRFADDWKHGMLGGWPVFVPGFFLLTLATALWSRDRSWREIVGQGIGVIIIATIVARALAPLGTARLFPIFEHAAGLMVQRRPIDPPLGRSATGVFTLVSWCSLVIAYQYAVIRHRVWPLIPPIGVSVLLNGVRPGELRSLVEPWTQRLQTGDPVAVHTTILIPLLLALLWWHARRSPKAR